jgi:protein ImuB
LDPGVAGEEPALGRRPGGGWRSRPDEGEQGAPARPLRLFARPEPIDALAEVPDGPPIRFRWRRVLHDVAAIEGPERIAAPWWRREDAPTRDYFRAEDSSGRRFWLYREGLWGKETERAKWFVHGVFG